MVSNLSAVFPHWKEDAVDDLLILSAATLRDSLSRELLTARKIENLYDCSAADYQLRQIRHVKRFER